jgi:AcrR family transcriptional regulator
MRVDAMPLSDCEVRDPRIRRTRQLLQGALRTLLQSKTLEEISVQDIAEAATINRATFYDHYTDKFSLLESMIAGGFHLMLHEREVNYDGTCPSAAAAIIQAACDYIVQIHERPPDYRTQSAFEPLVDSAITTAIRRVLIAGIEKYGAPQTISPEIRAAAVASAIYGAAKQWFVAASRPTVDQTVPEILALVLPMLQTSAAPHLEPLNQETAYR